MFDCFGGEVYASGVFNESESTPYDFNVDKNAKSVTSLGNMFEGGMRYRLVAAGDVFKIIK